MARTVLSLALLACLGLAILQLVSAEQEQQELEATSNEAVQAKAEEVQFRILREADAKKKKDGNKKKRNNNKKATKKGKGRKKGRKGGKDENKKPSNRRKKVGTKGKKGNGKNRRQLKGKGSKKGRKKGKGKNGRRGKGKGKKKSSNKDRKGGKGKKTQGNSKPKERQAACDVEGLCKQIKNYIKFSNQLRKLRRINRTCSTMEKKRDKAGGGEFSASAVSNADSGNDTVNGIAEELANCTATAKENCETKEIPACTNLTLNNKCDGELDAWIKQFGPAKGSCLQSAPDCCACINAITPVPSDDCLSFDALDISSKNKKKKCTGSGTKGSFGYCRTLQQNISSEGPKAHKEKCKGGSSSVTTAGVAGRRKVFRNNLIKKWIKS